jgi:hypothetical protein
MLSTRQNPEGRTSVNLPGVLRLGRAPSRRMTAVEKRRSASDPCVFETCSSQSRQAHQCHRTYRPLWSRRSRHFSA